MMLGDFYFYTFVDGGKNNKFTRHDFKMPVKTSEFNLLAFLKTH